MRNIEDVEHIFCGDCHVPGDPMMCGAPDDGSEIHDEGCGHPLCSMCVIEWEPHVCDMEEER